jgi:hypothetical protein
VSEYAVTSDPYVTATNRPVTGEHETEYQFEALGMVATDHDDPLSEYATVVEPYATATNRPVTGEHVTEIQLSLGMVTAVHDDPLSE